MKLETFGAFLLGALLLGAAGRCSVGERAPSLSPGVPHASRADSEAAPARTPRPPRVGGGSGEDGGSSDLADFAPRGRDSGSDAPASTVTQSALTATVTAYTVIDPVPATPLASARPVETLAPRSNNQSSEEIGQLIAASPWPPHLWGTVACLVQRESRGVATAVGLAGERGILQVHPITWPYLAQYGITPDALFDPATNLRAGYLLFIEAGGLRPWNGGCA